MPLSGWCIDTFHESCDDNVGERFEWRCTCSCHGEKEEK